MPKVRAKTRRHLCWGTRAIDARCLDALHRSQSDEAQTEASPRRTAKPEMFFDVSGLEDERTTVDKPKGIENRMRGMGWLPDHPDFRDYTFDNKELLRKKEIRELVAPTGLERARASTLPASVDLRRWCSSAMRERATVSGISSGEKVPAAQSRETRRLKLRIWKALGGYSCHTRTSKDLNEP
jgi:hypothetical protein